MTTLNEVRDFLLTVPEDFVFAFGFDSPRPWRGDFCQVAFTPNTGMQAREMLACIDEAVTRSFSANKGGEIFLMLYTLSAKAHLETGHYTESAAAEEFDNRFQNMKDEFTQAAHREISRRNKRKTKAQKQAEGEQYYQQQKQIAFEKFKETYQTRLLKLVAQYIEFDFSGIRSSNEQLEFTEIGLSFGLEFDSWPDWEEVDYHLENCQRMIDDKIRKIKEANELLRKQEEALSKLTEEDKRVLGLWAYNIK